MTIDEAWRAAVLAYPMHGQRKLTEEGYRTRDGHIIQWLGRSTANRTADHGSSARTGALVVSRPEPFAVPHLPSSRRRGASAIAEGTRSIEPHTWRLPDPRNRRQWWVRSAGAYPSIPGYAVETPAVVWNPFVALAQPDRNPFAGSRTVVLDLLDDWSRHYAFESIRPAVERAYAAAFAGATHVTANGEGTVALAERYGRDDVVFLPNGVDPERFDPASRATGRTTIGYVGKIGRRLDLGGIVTTVTSLPDVEFVFAGPILDSEYRGPLAALPNVRLLGDVHYEDVPALLQTFDIGWVPHRVGDHEVGGDIIKTYEYRAAGLPTLSAPVDGAGARGLDGVMTRPVVEHPAAIRELADAGVRVPRIPTDVPPELTWRHKTATIVDLLGLSMPVRATP